MKLRSLYVFLSSINYQLVSSGFTHQSLASKTTERRFASEGALRGKRCP